MLDILRRTKKTDLLALSTVCAPSSTYLHLVIGERMRSYGYLMSDTGSGAGHYVELQEDKLKELLGLLLAFVEVDERWYLSTYKDVADAVKSGGVPSARAHYISAGFYENRLPRPVTVDEDWYLSEYPDVADAIKTGALLSATQHFTRSGFAEGRLPAAGWSLINKTAGGTGNVKLTQVA